MTMERDSVVQVLLRERVRIMAVATAWVRAWNSQFDERVRQLRLELRIVRALSLGRQRRRLGGRQQRLPTILAGLGSSRPALYSL